jgi:hypothetical protein
VEEWWLPTNGSKGIGGAYGTVALGISVAESAADEAEMSS